MSETNQQVKHIVVTPTKSVGLAIILTVLFGPLGMFYTTIWGGIIMSVVFLLVVMVVGSLTLGLGLVVVLPILWAICVLWAAMASNSYNRKLLAGEKTA